MSYLERNVKHPPYFRSQHASNHVISDLVLLCQGGEGRLCQAKKLKGFCIF